VRIIRTALLVFTAASLAQAQLLSNATLSGKYFVRHVQISTDINNTPTDERSLIGSLTFDGKGGYSFSGQQVIGSGAPGAFSISGTYGMKQDGELSLTNPQQPGFLINARYGSEAILGATTEAPGGIFDIFVAIPAPLSTASDSKATLAVSYNFVDYELSVTPLQLTTAGGALQFDGAGNVAMTTGQGHSTGINAGAPQKQTPGGGYTVNADGTGTLTFQLPTGTAASGAIFGTGVRTLAISQSGNMVIAGTPGGHDLLIGLRNAATDNLTLPAAFAGRYWVTDFQASAGTQGSLQDFVGSLTVISADNAAIITQRVHASSVPSHYNLTSSSNYAVAKGGGSLNAGSAVLLVGKGGNFLGVDVGGTTAQPDANGYAIILGVQIPTVSGTGVFLNPQGVINAASNAPVGSPISPGEFITLYGSGLAASTVVAAPPYPSQAGGVSVSIGGLPAPIYLVSSGQINCLVPYGVSIAAGTTTIVVTNAGTASNTVTVPIAASSPGIFSADLSGQGDGAVVHQSGALVNAANPAQPNELLTMYLTGMGALQTPIGDGVAPGIIDSVTTNTTLQIDGVTAKLQYSGIQPSYPGLYQINFYVPPVPDHGEVQMILITSDSATSEISLFVQ
jgi:uncharacterized protein (TIGR03437 family)